MSLVNDLLIEAERRRRAQARPREARLDDLVPTRTRPALPAGARPLRIALLALASLGAVAGVFGVVGIDGVDGTGGIDHVGDASGADPLGPLATLIAGSPPDANDLPPPVAARREGIAYPIEAASTPARAKVERPVRIESISIERLPGTTRLRIVADGRTAHRLEHDAASARLELVLANAALVDPTGPIDLLDTPIQTLDLRAETPDLHLSLAIDADVHIQTRWLALERGAALVLDLQAPASSRGAASLEARAVEPGPAQHPAPVGAAPAEHHQFIDSVPDAPDGTNGPAALAPNDDAESAYTDEAILAAITPEGADRVYSPSLGDPAALRIEPSQREREREERAERSAKLTGALAAARRARTTGRLEEADAQYAEIVLLAPNDPVPVVEWADVLVELDRGADALALVDSARDRAPRDQTLLIAKARLLERTGDLAGAVTLLDQSGLALTEAPDIHALAAAYQQRAGHHEAAIERYEQILRRFPEESRGWMGLGVSLEAVGRKREARDVYRIALSVGPLPGGARHWVMGRLTALGEKD